MSQEPLKIEFHVDLGKRPPAAKLEPGAKRERLRQDRAARRVRNLALAHWINGLILNGEVADLAAVSRMCGVSRARVTAVISTMEAVVADQERLLRA